MPISFEQPQPFSPAISSAYGAAQVMQANNALLLQQQQMRQSAYEHAAQLSGQQAMQQAELAQRGAQHRDEMAFRQQALDQEGQVTGRDVFQAQAKMAAQAQSADLQHWYASQEMTQHEAILLQRKRQAAAEVENSNAERSVKDDMLAQIWTGTSILEAKERAARAKQIEQAIQSAKTQDQLNAAKLQMASKAAAMTAAERTPPLYDEGLEDQLDAELVQRQQAGEVGDLTPQERQAYIRREAQARGGLRGYRIIQPDGSVDIKELKPPAGSGSGSGSSGSRSAAAHDHPSGLSPQQYRIEYDNAVKRVQAIADKEAEKNDDRELRSRARIKADAEADMEMRGLPKNFEEYQKLAPKAAAREPWAGVLPKKQPPAAAAQAAPAAPGQQPAGGSPKPEETITAPPEPATPQPKFEVSDIINRPDKLTPDQRQKTALLADLAAKAAVAPGLSPAQRAGFKAHADWMAEKLAEYGSLHAFHKKEPKEYARFVKAMEMFANLPEPPAEAKAGPAPPQARVPSGRLSFTARPGQSVNPGGF